MQVFASITGEQLTIVGLASTAGVAPLWPSGGGIELAAQCGGCPLITIGVTAVVIMHKLALAVAGCAVSQGKPGHLGGQKPLFTQCKHLFASLWSAGHGYSMVGIGAR